MNKKRKLQYIRKLIGKDRLKEAIELLEPLTKADELSDDVIMQSAKYSEVKKMIRRDVISFENANISKSKIRSALLELVTEIEDYEKKHHFLPKRSQFVIGLVLLLGLIFTIDFFSKKDYPFPEKEQFTNLPSNTPMDSVNMIDTTSINNHESSTEVKIIQNTNSNPQVRSPVVKLPTIEGQILDKNNIGIHNATILTSEGLKVISNEVGLFKIELTKPQEDYPSKIYLYFSKDSFQSKDLVRVGQKNVVLKFE